MIIQHYVAANANPVRPDEATLYRHLVTYADHIEALRACEERVRGEEQQRIEAALTSVGQHDVGWELAIRDKALRDAREAVLGAKAIDVYYGRGLDDPPQFIWLNNALAAIDALTEKQ